MRTLLFIMKFFLLGAFFIISSQGLALSEEGNIQIFTQMYKDWIFGVGDNIGSLTSYVVKVEWLPSEDYVFQKNDEIIVPRHTTVRR